MSNQKCQNSITNYACRHLKTLDIPDNSELRLINESDFRDSMIEKVKIPSKLEEIQSCCFSENKKMTKIEISKENKSFFYYSNALIIGKSTLLSDRYYYK